MNILWFVLFAFYQSPLFAQVPASSGYIPVLRFYIPSSGGSFEGSIVVMGGKGGWSSGSGSGGRGSGIGSQGRSSGVDISASSTAAAERSAGLLAGDLAGFNAHDQRREEMKEEERYRQELKEFRDWYVRALENLPQTTKDIPTAVTDPLLNENSIMDDQGFARYAKSPHAILHSKFATYRDVMTFLGANGMKLSTGATRDVELLNNVMEMVSEAEWISSAKQFEANKASTVSLLGEFGRDSSSNEEEIKRKSSSVSDAIKELANKAPPPPPTVDQGPKEPSLRSIYDRLELAQPTTPQAEAAKAIGLSSVEAADEAYTRGDQEAANFYKSVAGSMAEIAMGFIPIVGEGQALYELLTGKSLITGQILTPEERALAGVSLLTLGMASSVEKLGVLAMRVARETQAVEKITSLAGKIAQSLHTTQWGKILGNARGSIRFSAISDRANKLLTDAQRSRLIKISNIFEKHAKPHDFEGVLNERKGRFILKPTGEPYNHIDEMTDAMKGLEKATTSLQNSLKNPSLDSEVRAVLEMNVRDAQEMISKMKKALND